jgi:hypothetical protein
VAKCAPVSYSKGLLYLVFLYLKQIVYAKLQKLLESTYPWPGEYAPEDQTRPRKADTSNQDQH